MRRNGTFNAVYFLRNMEDRKKGIKPVENKKEQERCILVGIATPKVRPWLAGEQLAELGRLAETAGAYVTRSFLQRVQNFSPAPFEMSEQSKAIFI